MSKQTPAGDHACAANGSPTLTMLSHIDRAYYTPTPTTTTTISFFAHFVVLSSRQLD